MSVNLHFSQRDYEWDVHGIRGGAYWTPDEGDQVATELLIERELLSRCGHSESGVGEETFAT